MIQLVHASPTSLVAQLDSPDQASSTAEAWGILIDTGAATSVAPKGFASHIKLSPVPFTLQLTTATGQAIETYGLRKVHLQSRGLSLEVNFVIADVVTPLLGLDIMLQDTLSLQVDHGPSQVLVNQAGDRTQLQHMGRHLYLIACPSEHSLSPCVIGSLSQVIGFSAWRQGTSWAEVSLPIFFKPWSWRSHKQTSSGTRQLAICLASSFRRWAYCKRGESLK